MREMGPRFYPILEHPTAGLEVGPGSGRALARVVEAHPALVPLLDFDSADPTQIALAVGMVYAYEEDGAADLEEIDLGPPEWFEPVAGLAACRRALAAVRNDPDSLATAVYAPGLRADDVIADLEAIERILLLALEHERRFRFMLTGK